MTPQQVLPRLKAHLLSGKSITPLQALKKWGTFRLVVYVHRLRRNYKIKTEMVTKGKKTYAKYSYSL